MRKLAFILVIIVSVLNTKAQDKIKWLSFEEAIALNKETPKPILIDIYTDWCGYCKKMDLETYANKTIIASININFYAVKLDGEQQKDIVFKDHTFKFQKSGRKGYHELPAALMDGKLGYPTTVFMSKEEQVIQKIPGYLSKKRFEKILAFFANDNYKTKEWDSFEKTFESKI